MCVGEKRRKKIMKNVTKLKKLKAWLDENNFSHHVPRSLEKGNFKEADVKKSMV